MKTCSCCLNELNLSEFAHQKTNPSKLYAWCNYCRNLAEETKVNIGRRYSYTTEVAEMRAKAKELRKMTDAQSVEMKQRHKNGEKTGALAACYKVSKTTIYKELRRTA